MHTRKVVRLIEGVELQRIFGLKSSFPGGDAVASGHTEPWLPKKSNKKVAQSNLIRNNSNYFNRFNALRPKIMSVSQFVVFLHAIVTHMGHKCGGRKPLFPSQKDRLLTQTSGEVRVYILQPNTGIVLQHCTNK